MVDRLVLVNGLPGSGKTTLAGPLARHLAADLVAKDPIKEAMADAVPGAPSAVLGAAAMEAAWTIVAGLDDTVVFEAWWLPYRDRPYVEAGLVRCGHPVVVEVWCDVAPELAQRRYAHRRRHPIHEDPQRLADPGGPWASGVEPLGVGPVVRVPTDRPVDLAEVTRNVSRLMGDHRSA